jgi:hypothetical protein
MSKHKRHKKHRCTVRPSVQQPVAEIVSETRVSAFGLLDTLGSIFQWVIYVLGGIVALILLATLVTMLLFNSRL